MAVAERVWFVVSFVTTPGLKPALVSLSDALRASPVNVVPLSTATVTLPRLTFAAAPEPAAFWLFLAGVLADAGGATVFGTAGGLLSLPPPMTTKPMMAASAT